MSKPSCHLAILSSIPLIQRLPRQMELCRWAVDRRCAGGVHFDDLCTDRFVGRARRDGAFSHQDALLMGLNAHTGNLVNAVGVDAQAGEDQ